MGSFIKKWFHLVLIFVFAYLAGSLAGHAANQFLSVDGSSKNTIQKSSPKPVALTENGIPIYSASADGNWGLSFPSPGQAPVGNTTNDYLKQFNACYMAASYYYLPMGELEEYFSALQTGLRQERANSKAWNNVLTLCAQSLYQLPASQMDVYMDGIASIQEQMEQANEAMLVDIALEPYNQALLEAVNTARAQGLEGQEAYNHLVIAMAQQASE